MAPDFDEFDRHSIRIPGFDYAWPGAFFITLCCAGKRCLFGSVVDAAVHVNSFGDIVQQEWARSAAVRRELTMDAFVVMPNHIHGVVWIGQPWYIDEPQTGDRPAATARIGSSDLVGDQPVAPTAPRDEPDLERAIFGSSQWTPYERPWPAGPAPRSLASFVAGFKATTTARINTMRATPGVPVWQRGFYEHVVRSGKQLLAIRRYILENPARWERDAENPERRR